MAVVSVGKGLTVTVATGGIEIEEYTRLNSGKSVRRRVELEPLFTFYYPYTFYEWKVTVPRWIFSDTKALIRVGVNGLTGLAAQTEIWPDTVMKTVEKNYCLPFKASGEIVETESHRALENYLFKSLRPMIPPIRELNRKETIYLPYHLYKEKRANGKVTFQVLEALTKVKAEVKKMDEVRIWIEERLF
ncbi:hypothetical protein ACQ4XT_02930 [Halobacillus faecis]